MQKQEYVYEIRDDKLVQHKILGWYSNNTFYTRGFQASLSTSWYRLNPHDAIMEEWADRVEALEEAEDNLKIAQEHLELCKKRVAEGFDNFKARLCK